MDLQNHLSRNKIVINFLDNDDKLRFESQFKNTELNPEAYSLKGDKGLIELVNKAPDIAVIEIKSSDSIIGEVKRLLAAFGPSVRLVLIGENIDVNTYRSLIRLGVEDYLFRPIDHDVLRQTILEIAQEDLKRQFPRNGIAFWGVKGGVGTSTIAANTAWYIAERKNRKVALVDTDMHMGTSAFAIDNQNFGQLSSILTYFNDIDDLVVKRSLIEVSNNLVCLNDSLDCNQVSSLNSDSIVALSEYLDNSFSNHIWDLTSLRASDFSGILDQIKVVVLCTDLSLSGARSAAKALSFLKEFEKIRPLLVVSNVQKKSSVLMTRQELEKAVGMDVSIEFDCALSDFVRAQEKGGVLANGKTKWARKIAYLADDCLGYAKKNREYGVFSRILSR